MTVPLVNRQARAGEQATYFTWGGYDYPALFSSYAKRHGKEPEFSVYADAEEGFQKLRSGYVVDTVHPCYNDVLRWRTSGLFQPIDTSRLSNWGDVMPRLQTLDGIQIDGEQWFVPVDWGQTSITYRTDLVDLSFSLSVVSCSAAQIVPWQFIALLGASRRSSKQGRARKWSQRHLKRNSNRAAHLVASF